MRIIFIVLLSLSLAFGGCSTAEKKKNAQLSSLIYATKDSIKAGRIDLAQKYTEEAARLTPPPKKRIVVKEFIVDIKLGEGIFSAAELGKPMVVLPPQLLGHVIIKDSEDYKKALIIDSALQKQTAEEEKALSLIAEKNDSILRELSEESIKDKTKSNWFSWFTGLGAVGIIGIIALCLIFPAAVPLAINVFSSFLGVINTGIRYIGNLFKK